MAKKKFLDLDGAKALKTGMTGTVGKLTTGLLLPFDGILEDTHGVNQMMSGIRVPAGESPRIVWVPKLQAFRALTGGEHMFEAYPAEEAPVLPVASVDYFTDKYKIITFCQTEELQFSAETISTKPMPVDMWMEIKPSKVVRRDTGAEVDTDALGLRVYAGLEDCRWASPTSIWLYPFFATREVTLAEFEAVGDWPTWLQENFALTAQYAVPAGATVKILNKWGTRQLTLFDTWSGDAVYKDTASLERLGLLCKEDSTVYRCSGGTLTPTEQIGISLKDMEHIHPGYEYGRHILRRWESVSDKTEYNGERFTCPSDKRLVTELPERLPALDLSQCTTVNSYPVFVNLDKCSPIREMAAVDLSNAEAVHAIGQPLMVTIPALDMGNVKDGTSAFNGLTSAVGISVFGAQNKDRGSGDSRQKLPELTIAQSMFQGCRSLTGLPAMETPKLTNMNSFAHTCRSIQSAPWMDTGNVTTMRAVLCACMSMAYVPAWDTSKVTDFFCAFYNCRSLLRFPRWSLASAQSVNAMCSGCVSLEEAGELNTTVCKDFVNLFANCKNLRKVESVDLGAATTTTSMFAGCAKLDYIVFAKLPMGTCTLDLSGLTAWGTTDAGKQSMEKCADALIERVGEGEGILTMRIPTATYARWQAAFSDLDGYMAEANVTVVKL